MNKKFGFIDSIVIIAIALISFGVIGYSRYVKEEVVNKNLGSSGRTVLSTSGASFTAPYFVATNSSATTTLAGGLVVDTNTLVVDYSSNKVGIGTTAPAARLQVSGGNVIVDSAANPQIGMYNGSTFLSAMYTNSISGDVSLYASANGTTPVMNLKSGNVGIGTTTPYSKLFVTNTGTDPSFVVEDTTSPDSTPFIIDANGNVGLGTQTLDSSALTMGSTFANGIVQYNTADQTTNYERVKSAYTSNEFWLLSQIGGSGSRRDIGIGYSTNGGTGGGIKVQADALPYTQIWVPSSNSTSNPHFDIGVGAGGGAGLDGSSGTQVFAGITPVWNQSSTAGGIDLRINRTETAIGSGQHDFINMSISSVTKARIDRTGHIFVDATNTAGGTTGNQTINKPSGTVNFAAAASSLTVTNSTVSTASIILTNVRTNDATCTVKNAVPGSGSFVITMTAACTAETSVGFVIIN